MELAAESLYPSSLERIMVFLSHCHPYTRGLLHARRVFRRVRSDLEALNGGSFCLASLLEGARSRGA